MPTGNVPEASEVGTSLLRTLSMEPMVSALERFHCIIGILRPKMPNNEHLLLRGGLMYISY